MADFLSEGIARVAVPFFFLAAGFFLAGHVGEDGWYGNEVMKRVKSLMLPFLCWCLIYELVLWSLLIVTNMYAGRGAFDGIGSHVRGLMQVLGMDRDHWSMASRLWFLRSLFLYVIISPIVVLCQRYLHKWAVAIPFALLPFTGFGYFSLGMILRMRGIEVRIGRRLGAGCIALGALIIITRHFIPLPQTFFQTLMILSLMGGLWSLMPTSELPRFLKGTSFPIYVMHSVILVYFMQARNLLRMTDVVSLVAIWLFTIASILIVSSGIKQFPELSSLLFGGRK